MRRQLLFFIVLQLFVSIFSNTGVVLLQGTAGNSQITGKITLTYVSEVNSSRTVITGSISGLQPNTVHGFHIHEFGDLSKIDGTGTGGHWNPYGGVHGFLTQNNSHAGDLGNVTANALGIADVNITSTKVLLNGNVSAIGKGMIVHQLFDDGVSQPTGAAGKRYAQGVIGIQNFANNKATSELNSFAVCEFEGLNSTLYGRVLFTQNSGQSTVRVQATICGLTPNSAHGFHVHQYGDLTGADRTANVGGHWNPLESNHAYPPSSSRHFGDMGNITADKYGVAIFDSTFDLLALNGNNSIVGRAIVIHEKADDGAGATGNAGNKLGSCVIGYKNSLPNLPTCPKIAEATVLLVGTSGNEGISGKITIQHIEANTSRITGSITGLAENSIHGFHIHQFGDLSKTDGTGTGGHWNPYGGVHGFLTDSNSHAGDLGNITADSQGTATVNITSTKLSLLGDISAIGKGMIVHQLFDDGISQPTGAAGKRFAQGIVGIKNTAINQASSEQNSFAVCEFKGLNSKTVGRILFTQNIDSTVRVQSKICGLTTNGAHGFHVHEFGDLTGIDRTTSVGGHWNPLGSNHAYPPSSSRHFGDMGNITVDKYGTGTYDNKLDLLTLNGINSVLGRAVVVHEKNDDGAGATGNAGSKLGSCVIGSVDTLPSLPTCPKPGKASVLLKGTKGNEGISGKIYLNFDGQNTHITGTVSGLNANSIHGFHIHQFGDISKEDGTATGGHWNPNGGVHGFLSDTNSHAGDLGNITANSQGISTIDINSTKVLLNGNVSAVGLGMIIHELPDDGVSQPTGAAGKRLAQGVIGIQNDVNSFATNEKNSFAVCEFGSGHDYLYGRILFTQNAGNVTVQAIVCGLNRNGIQGFHVHQYGDLTGTEITSNVGGHWNPLGSNHSFPPSTSRHFGDMGNILSNQEGKGKYEATLNLLDLNGEYSIIGRAVVIHEKNDDGTGATGNAGNKIGSCVIGAVNTLPSLPTCPVQISGAEATVLLVGTAGNEKVSGNATLSYSSGKTTIKGTVEGLSANSIHGFHIHSYGDLSKTDGTGTGGHWNPYNGVHGPLTLSTRHAGDLGNITADSDGIAKFTIVTEKLPLSGELSAVGKGMIVHQLPDDGVSQPTGNAGSRYAQGVIGIKSKATCEKNKYAVCEFFGSLSKNLNGRILFTQHQNNTVTVEALICGLMKSTSHGFHVHEFGDLTGSSRTSNVGGHWNPLGSNHSYPSTPIRHFGDMGNITVNDGGVAVYINTLDLLTLNGNYSIVGRAVVIHEKNDDGAGATGNAGSKLGSCVIGSVDTLPSLPATCPTSTTGNASTHSIGFMILISFFIQFLL
eukprot:gene11166-3987_t